MRNAPAGMDEGYGIKTDAVIWMSGTGMRRKSRIGAFTSAISDMLYMSVLQ